MYLIGLGTHAPGGAIREVRHCMTWFFPFFPIPIRKTGVGYWSEWWSNEKRFPRSHWWDDGRRGESHGYLYVRKRVEKVSMKNQQLQQKHEIWRNAWERIKEFNDHITKCSLSHSSFFSRFQQFKLSFNVSFVTCRFHIFVYSVRKIIV